MATQTIDQKQTRVLGTLLFELMTGNLSDETIAAVDELGRDEVPQHFREMVGFMHGMTTEPYLRHTVITHLVREIAGEARELSEELEENAPPIVPPAS